MVKYVEVVPGEGGHENNGSLLWVDDLAKSRYSARLSESKQFLSYPWR